MTTEEIEQELGQDVCEEQRHFTELWCELHPNADYDTEYRNMIVFAMAICILKEFHQRLLVC